MRILPNTHTDLRKISSEIKGIGASALGRPLHLKNK